MPVPQQVTLVVLLQQLHESGGSAQEHVAILRMVIIPGAIEIGGHQADRIKAMLFAQSFTELYSGDLGSGIPLIGRLNEPVESTSSGSVARRTSGKCSYCPKTAGAAPQHAKHFRSRESGF